MTKKRILIIAGSSYVGQNLIEELSDDNIVFSTFHSNQSIDRHHFYLDLSDIDFADQLKSILPLDTLIWCAQSKDYAQDIQNYNSLFQINVVALQKLLDFSAQNHVKHFIYLSSGTVYKPPMDATACDENAPINLDSFYGFSKYTGEQISRHYALHSPLKVTTLRLYAVYGEGQQNKIIPRLWQSILNKQPIQLNSKIGMIFNAIYIEDLMKIIKLFINQNPHSQYRVFNIANPEVLNLRDVCETLGRIENKPITIENISKPIYYSLADISQFKKEFKEFIFTSFENGIQQIKKK